MDLNDRDPDRDPPARLDDEDAPGLDDAAYLPDPDDDPDARDDVAARDVAALTRSAVIVSVAAVLFFGVLALLGVPGMQSFARGFAIGCVVATLNLRMLAGAAWGIFNQRVVFALVGFFASFATLIGVALWLGKAHPDWILGYGVGLAIPGGAGLYYAFETSRTAARKAG